MTIRSPKKSETIEIRLPHQTKTAFMARCRTDGRTASEALRGFIDGELASGRSPGRLKFSLWQALVAASAGLAIGAIAAPSLAQNAAASPNAHAWDSPSKAAFARLDQDHDGVVTLAEFQVR
ncbi:EF-hand domain-containing protein [soil metagenome]